MRVCFPSWIQWQNTEKHVMHLCINVMLISPGSYIHADKWQRESPLKQLSEFDKSFADIRYTKAYITPWVYNTCMSISTSILFPLGMSTGRYVVCPNSHLFYIAGTWCTTQWVLGLYYPKCTQSHVRYSIQWILNACGSLYNGWTYLEHFCVYEFEKILKPF